jgi:hypothetical protein
VILPPGCSRSATNPCATGSETRTNTTGMVLVASRITVRERGIGAAPAHLYANILAVDPSILHS